MDNGAGRRTVNAFRAGKRLDSQRILVVYALPPRSPCALGQHFDRKRIRHAHADAALPEGKADEIREAAKKIYRALDCDGLSRVDFFLENGTNRVIFNEINTIPGFTSISMYPKLWETAGIPLRELVERLIESAAVTPHFQKELPEMVNE